MEQNGYSVISELVSLLGRIPCLCKLELLMVGKALLLFTVRNNPIPPTCTYSPEKVGLASGGGLDQRLLTLHKKTGREQFNTSV